MYFVFRQKAFEVNPTLWVGLPGLATDTQTVLDKIKFRVGMYELREGRKITPKYVLTVLKITAKL